MGGPAGGAPRGFGASFRGIAGRIPVHRRGTRDKTGGRGARACFRVKRSGGREGRPCAGAPRARTGRPSRSRSPARARRPRTPRPPTRRRSSSTSRSRRRCTAPRSGRPRQRRSRPGPADLAWVVVPHDDSGFDSRPELEQLRVGVPLGELVVRPAELRHGRREADPVDAAQVEEAPVESAQLVAAPVPFRRNPPVLGQIGTIEQPEGGLCVADVDGEQHASMITDRSPSRSARRLRPALRVPQLDAVARVCKVALASGSKASSSQESGNRS